MSKKDIAISLIIALVLVTLLTLWVRNGVKQRAEDQEQNNVPTESVVEDGLYVFAGPTWVWQETKYSDGLVVAPKERGVYTVRFDSTEGHVFGTTDCNGFSASYTSSAWGRLTFGPSLSTLMFCEGSQEPEFRKMIEESDRYIFTASGDLMLLLKMDSGSVLFKKQ